MCGPSTGLDILFHRNDPQVLEGTHGHPHAFTTSRKPDIVIVGLPAAKRVCDRENRGETWDSMAKLAAINPPPVPFTWYDICCSIEKKFSNNVEEPSFELSKLAKMPPPVPPQNNVNALLDSKKCTASSSTQPSKRQKTASG